MAMRKQRHTTTNKKHTALGMIQGCNFFTFLTGELFVVRKNLSDQGHYNDAN